MKKVRLLKNRLLVILSFIMLATLSLVTLVGCGDGGTTDKKEPSIVLNQSFVSTTVYSTFQLRARLYNVEGSVEWKSLDQNVVFVDDNGKATALSEGQTIIQAKVGELTKECMVLVDKDSQIPFIKVNNLIENKITLYRNNSFVPDFALGYNGITHENAQFILESLDENVAIIENGAIKAVGLGECQVKAYATLCGKVLPETTMAFEISVVEDVEFKLNQSTVTIYAVQNLDGKDYTTTFEIECDLYKEGVKVDNPELTFVSNDQDIVSVNDQGVIQALRCGQTTVSIQHGKFIKDLIVKVDYAVAEKTDQKVFFNKKTDTEFSATEIFGENKQIEKIYDITDQNDISNLKPLDLTKLNKTGERTYLFCNANYATKASVIVADYVIANAQDLVAFVTSATNEYAVVSQNINASGVTIKGTTVFGGVLDGLGNTISGLSLTGDTQGLFSQVSGATIRNLVITDTVKGNNGGVLAYQVRNGAVTVENVVMSVTLDGSAVGTFQGAMLGMFWGGAATVKNCIVYVNNELAPAKQGILFGALRNSSSASLINTHVVSASGNIVSGWSGSSLVDPTELNASITPYATANAFSTAIAENKVDLSDWLKATWNAIKPLEAVELGTSYYAKGGTNDLIVDIAKVSGDITKVTLAKAQITTNINQTNLTVSASDLSALAVGEYELGIYTQGVVYKQIIKVADSVISNATQLKTFVESATGEYAILSSDIDLTNTSLNSSTTFAGTLDGDGHTISNLTNNLFNTVGGGATIKNLAIVKVDIKADQTGAIAKTSAARPDTVTITNVFVSGKFSAVGGTFQGGLIGQVNYGYYTNISNTIVHITSELTTSAQGIMIGAIRNGVVNLDKCYSISSNGDATSTWNNIDSSAVNNSLTKFASASSFDQAISTQTVALSDWQLSVWNSIKA